VNLAMHLTRNLVVGYCGFEGGKERQRSCTIMARNVGPALGTLPLGSEMKSVMHKSKTRGRGRCGTLETEPIELTS
jgi:hypothetical protein